MSDDILDLTPGGGPAASDDDLVVDLTGVKGGFDVIRAGTYHAKVTDSEVRESGPNSKNPGSKYVNWEFTIQDGEFSGRKQWMNTSLLPQALFGLKDLMAATGFDTDGAINVNQLRQDIIGRDCCIVVKIKLYEGDERNEIKRVKALRAEDLNTSSGGLLP